MGFSCYYKTTAELLIFALQSYLSITILNSAASRLPCNASNIQSIRDPDGSHSPVSTGGLGSFTKASIKTTIGEF